MVAGTGPYKGRLISITPPEFGEQKAAVQLLDAAFALGITIAKLAEITRTKAIKDTSFLFIKSPFLNGR